jgi:hypothetical protein
MRPPRSAQDPGPSTRPPTPYETRLYSLCSAIPPGKVSTYGALAEVLRSSPRAVGQVRPVRACSPRTRCAPVRRSGPPLDRGPPSDRGLLHTRRRRSAATRLRPRCPATE